jgi:hypothetical protein
VALSPYLELSTSLQNQIDAALRYRHVGPPLVLDQPFLADAVNGVAPSADHDGDRGVMAVGLDVDGLRLG